MKKFIATIFSFLLPITFCYGAIGDPPQHATLVNNYTCSSVTKGLSCIEGQESNGTLDDQPLNNGFVTNHEIKMWWTSWGGTEYDIRYSNSAITTRNWGSATQVVDEPIPSGVGEIDNYTLLNLSTSTTYYVALKYYSGGVWSAVQTIIGPVTTTLDLKSDIISWQQPDSDPNVDGYKIYWGEIGDFSNIIDVGLVYSYNFNNLDYTKAYNFKVTAYDTDTSYESNYSNVVIEYLGFFPPMTGTIPWLIVLIIKSFFQ